MPSTPTVPSTLPSMPSAFGDLVAGVAFVGRGARLLFATPSLWSACAVSALVMAALLIGALALTLGRVDDLLGSLWARPDAGIMLLLWYVAAIGVAVAAGYLALVASVAAAGIVLAPLHDRLSEKVEQIVNPAAERPFELGVFLRDVFSGIAHTLCNLALFVLVGVPVLLLNLVPGIGSVASAVAGAIFTALMLAMEMSDYALARRRLRWRQKWGVIRRRPWLFLGFGLALAALLWIPLAGALTVPTAVVSGTLLVVASEQAGLIVTNR